MIKQLQAVQSFLMPVSLGSPRTMFLTSSWHTMVHEPHLAQELRIVFTVLKHYFKKKDCDRDIL